MKGDKPRGEELRIVKEFGKILTKVEKLCEGFEKYTPSCIEFRFAVSFSRDGVRVNGHERLTTIVDAVGELEEIQKEIASGLKKYQQGDLIIQKLVRESQELMKNYQLCGNCGGKKGEKVHLQHDPVYIRKWQDCEVCKGRGMVDLRRLGDGSKVA